MNPRSKHPRRRKPLWEREEARLLHFEDQYIVEEILDKRYNTVRNCYEYLVKWQNRPSWANNWESEPKLLDDVPELVVDFNDRLEEDLL